MHIIFLAETRPITYTCHEHQLLQISRFVQDYRRSHEDEVITLRPQEKIPSFKAQTVQLFLHWLYTNKFIESGDRDPSFSQLLEMYFFGYAYKITVLKNVVIDRLIEKMSECYLPASCTKRIYKFTGDGDQLRNLWVDAYVWEVPEEQLSSELESGNLHPMFLRDLALAQIRKLRAEGPKLGFNLPPYEKSKSAYHRRDEDTGVCCRRIQYEGVGFPHRGEYEQENTYLKRTMEKLQVRLETLKRKESENSMLKRSLQRLQAKLSKAEMRPKRHVSIDHLKLFQLEDWDNPEILHPEVLRNRDDRGQSHS